MNTPRMKLALFAAGLVAWCYMTGNRSIPFKKGDSDKKLRRGRHYPANAVQLEVIPSRKAAFKPTNKFSDQTNLIFIFVYYLQLKD